MTLYARLIGMNVNSATSLSVNVSFGFPSTPNATNDTATNLSVTPPNNITALLLNQAIADVLVTYVNNLYSTSFRRADVLFVSGAVTLISL